MVVMETNYGFIQPCLTEFQFLLLLLLETVATHYKKSWGWVDVQVSNANYKVL